MEAKYLALSQSCKDLFPIMDLVHELSTTTMKLLFDDSPNCTLHIHIDNVEALVLGQLEPHSMTPWSKHYALKYHRFCEHIIGPRKIVLVKIATSDPLDDVFTKGLGPVLYEHLQKKLMGWPYPFVLSRRSVEGMLEGSRNMWNTYQLPLT